MRQRIIGLRSKRALATWLMPILSACALTACSLPGLRQQVQEIEGAGEIRGRVVTEARQDGRVVVLLFEADGAGLALRSSRLVASDQQFSFAVFPGQYMLAAFIDVNDDGAFQREEPAAIHGAPSWIPVAAKQTAELPPLSIRGPIEAAFDLQVDLEHAVAIGDVRPLSDPIFDETTDAMGLWRPLDHLGQGRAGLFMLQPYDPAKTPLLLIHGMNGAANDWAPFLERLDPHGLQPWVLQYPSGLPLELISDFLVVAVHQLRQRYRFHQVQVVAHSAGGLVARSFALKYAKRFPGEADTLGLVMTVSSPLLGMNSAAAGVRYSPIVVPAWRDVATGSEFVSHLNDAPWPAEVPYYLVFSYLAGSGDDGVVDMASQLPLSAQRAASGVYGLEAGHSAILDDQAFVELCESILNSRSQGARPGTP